MRLYFVFFEKKAQARTVDEKSLLCDYRTEGQDRKQRQRRRKYIFLRLRRVVVITLEQRFIALLDGQVGQWSLKGCDERVDIGFGRLF